MANAAYVVCCRTALLLLAFFLVASVLAGPVVSTVDGKVEGTDLGNGLSQFLGIPYAQPPVGNLRWKAPLAAMPWPGTRNATEFSASCYQSPSFFGVLLPNVSEDCLYLNVWSPSLNASSKLPVLFWIYGGGFTSGSSLLYPGSVLAAKENVVVVTINYRLNIFGFLATPSLVNESPVLNYGLQDQQLALKWVHQNIQNFGGDPNSVMIFGESAGGASVAMHLLMKKSWNYYTTATLESPGPWDYPTLEEAYAVANTTMSQNSTYPCSNSTFGTKEHLACLRTVPAKQLYDLACGNPLICEYIPCIDRQQLMDTPAALFAGGFVNKNAKGVIVGSNLAEGNVLVGLLTLSLFNTSNISQAQYDTVLEAIFASTPSLIATVKPWYQNIASEQGYFAAAAHIDGDYLITCGATIVADALAEAGVPVWKYMFSEATPQAPFSQFGISHGSELVYVFDDPQLENFTFTSEQQTVSDAMGGYWAALAMKHSPNGDSNGAGQHSTATTSYWPAYNTTVKETLVLNSTFPQLTAWDNSFCTKWKPLLVKPLGRER